VPRRNPELDEFAEAAARLRPRSRKKSAPPQIPDVPPISLLEATPLAAYTKQPEPPLAEPAPLDPFAEAAAQFKKQRKSPLTVPAVAQVLPSVPWRERRDKQQEEQEREEQRRKQRLTRYLERAKEKEADDERQEQDREKGAAYWQERGTALDLDVKDERPTRAGELSDRQLFAIQVVRAMEEAEERIRIAKDIGLPTEEEQAELKRKQNIGYPILIKLGYIDPEFPSKRLIRQLQKHVWNTLLRNATKAVYRMLKGRQEFNKQEVAGEVAVYCYMNIHRFEWRSKLMTWVWAAARNLIISLLERNKARGVTGLGAGMTGSQIPLAVIDNLQEKGLVSEETAQYLRSSGLRSRLDSEELEALEAPSFDDEEAENLALQLAYGAEEDRIVAEAMSKLKPAQQEILKAVSTRGRIIFADGTEVDVGGDKPTNLVIAKMVGLPLNSVGGALYRARQALNQNMERPVVPPYMGTLANLVLVPAREAKLDAQGNVVQTTNQNDPQTIVAQAAPSPKVIRGRPARKPVEPKVRARPTRVEPSSWVDPAATYPLEVVLQGEQGSAALLRRTPSGQPEVLREFTRMPLAGDQRRYAYYSMGEARNNPAGEDSAFYYSDAMDLFDMLQREEITLEQYEVCMADIEADLTV